MTAAPRHPRVLVLDVGGTHVKFLATGEHRRRRFASGPKLAPAAMVETVIQMTSDWHFDAISIGYPGVVHDGVPVREPHHLGRGWVGFDFAAAFQRPVKIINDAAMQALGSYAGGTMLFLGLGTGLGSALIVHGYVVAMELGHLHCKRHRTYEDFIGEAGFVRLGKKKWRRKVDAIVRGFDNALLPDDIVIGGGRVDELKRLPPGARRGDNAAAFSGGFRLWEAQDPVVGAATRGQAASPRRGMR